MTLEGPKGRQTPKSIAALVNGRSVFSYVHFDPTEGIYRVACQRLDSLGRRVGAPIVLKQTSSDDTYGAGSVASDLSGRPPAAPSAAKAVKGRSFDAIVSKQAGAGRTRAHGSRISANGQIIEPQEVISLALRTQFFNQKGPVILPLDPLITIIVTEQEPAVPGGSRGVVAQPAALPPGSGIAVWETLATSTGNFLAVEDGAITQQNANGTTFALGISDSAGAGVHFWFK